ncbi:MAG: hypothetical protein RLZZ40_1125 [Actinomycetota bacterium]|jgi:hypothetical protein
MIYWLTVAGYFTLLGAMVMLNVFARRRPDTVAPIGDMLERIMTSRTTRIGIIAAWWWFGWHFIFAPPVG